MTKPSTIAEYNELQDGEAQAICNLLRNEIDKELKGATSKIWHGGPVWFIKDNPITGYAVRKKGVQLLFWSGQSFGELGLAPEGTFKAAEAYFLKVSDVDTDALKRWLEKSRDIQWDYKNIIKRKGQLVRLPKS